MPSWLDGRRNAFGAGALTLLLLTATVVTALRTDGYRATHVNLNDASVWISGDSVANGESGKHYIGRVNTEVAQVDGTVSTGAQTDVFQDQDVAIYKAAGESQVVSVDKSTLVNSKPVSLASASTEVAIGGGVVAALDPSTGNLWMSSAGQITGLSKKQGSKASVDKKSLLVMGTDGRAYTYAPGSSHGYSVGVAGDRRSWSIAATSSASVTGSDASTATGGVELSVVGSTAVVADTRAHKVSIAGGSSDSVTSDGAIALQQPSAPATTVVVATSSGMVAVPLAGGSPSKLVPHGVTSTSPPIGSEVAARPVVVAGCAYGVWSSSQVWEEQVCSNPGDPSFAGDPRLGSAGSLVFRTNHDRVVLEIPATGKASIIDKNRVAQLVTWTFEKQQDARDSKTKKARLPEAHKACDDPSKAKKFEDNSDGGQFGARAGVPTVVSLGQLELITPDCAVPAVTKVKISNASTGATATVINGGDAMQFGFDRVGTYQVIYDLNDGLGDALPGQRMVVHVEPNAAAPNSKPKIDLVRGEDRAPTAVAAGGVLEYNALDGTSEPDGDPVMLTDACVGSSNCLDASPADRASPSGAVSFKPDGWIRYAPQAAGTVTINFEATDVWGVSSRSSVGVQVYASGKGLAPVTHADHFAMVQGQQASVDVASNDVSFSGSQPILKSADVASYTPLAGSAGSESAAKSAISVTDGKLQIGTKLPAGTTLVKYVVGSPEGGENSTADGFARIDVAPAGAAPTVTAVRDEVALADGDQRDVDVTSNDIDSAGGVLAVTGASASKGTVQVLPDWQRIRVEPPAGFSAQSGPMLVTYTVSDGTESDATGMLVVEPYPSDVDQAPIVSEDTLAINAGEMKAIPVLANDEDPEGAPLHIVRVEKPSAGQVFIEGDELRYEAPATVPSQPVQLHYFVTDKVGAGALAQGGTSGLVTINVEAPRSTNNAPSCNDLTARVVQGKTRTISLPLMQLDPEGGIVSVAGIVKAPTHGVLTQVGEGFSYEAFDGDGDVGQDTATFQLTDGDQYSSICSIRIVVVNPQQDSLSATHIPVLMRPGQEREINLVDQRYVSSTSSSLSVPPNDVRFSTKIGHIGVVSATSTVLYTAPTLAAMGGAATAHAGIQYTIIDGNGHRKSNWVDITIDKNAKVPPPTAADDYDVPHLAGAKVHLDALTNDQDGAAGSPTGLTAAIVGANPDGVVMTKQGKVSFTMPSSHSVRFTYEVTGTTADGGAPQTARAIVSVPLDVGPECTAKTVKVKGGAKATFKMLSEQCKGPKNAKLKVVGVDLPKNGGTPLDDYADGNVTITTTKNSTSGQYPVVVQVCVAQRGASTTNVCPVTTRSVTNTILLGGNNSRPDLHETLEVPSTDLSTLNLRAKVHDDNPGDRAVMKFGRPKSENANLSVKLVNGSILQASANNKLAVGAHVKVTVPLNDTHGGRNTGEIDVTITKSDADPPVANPDNYTSDPIIVGKGDTTREYAVLENDVNPGARGDSKGKPLQVASVTPPAKRDNKTPASVSVTSDKKEVSFKPNVSLDSFDKPVTFTYTAQSSDAAEASRQATARVTVQVIGYPGVIQGQPHTEKNYIPVAGKATLSWADGDPDGDNPANVTYEVACFNSDAKGTVGSACGTRNDIHGTTYTFEGLATGHPYVFKVRTVNSAGAAKGGPTDDGWSAPSDAIWVDQLPGVPTELTVGDWRGPLVAGPTTGQQYHGPDGVGGQLTISWKEANGGSPITSYTIAVGDHTYTLAEGGVGTCGPGSSFSQTGGTCVATDLPNGKSVGSVSVTPHNRQTDDEHQPPNVSTRTCSNSQDCYPAVPPDPTPIVFTPTTSANGTCSVSFTQGNTYGHDVTKQYIVLTSRDVTLTYDVEGTWKAGQKVDDLPFPNCTVYFGRKYVATMRSENAVGISASSSPYEVQQDAVPDAIASSSLKVSLVNNSPGTVRFDLVRPFERGSGAGADANEQLPITSYEVLSDASPEAMSANDPNGGKLAGDTLQFTLSMVTGMSYSNIRVRAVNAKGAGAWTAVPAANYPDGTGTIEPVAKPTSPSGLNGVQSGNAINWSWSASGKPAGATSISYRANGKTQPGTSYTAEGASCGGVDMSIAVISVATAPGGYTFESDPATAEVHKDSTCKVSDTIEDIHLGGTWKRKTNMQGTWYPSSTHPVGGDGGWISNGTGIVLSCAAKGAGYDVFDSSNQQIGPWYWWAKLSDGYWVPIATVNGHSANDSSNGLPAC